MSAQGLMWFQSAKGHGKEKGPSVNISRSSLYSFSANIMKGCRDSHAFLPQMESESNRDPLCASSCQARAIPGRPFSMTVVRTVSAV